MMAPRINFRLALGSSTCLRLRTSRRSRMTHVAQRVNVEHRQARNNKGRRAGSIRTPRESAHEKMPWPIVSHRRSDRGDRSAHETNRSATAISERATLPPGPARLRKHSAKAIRDWSRPEQVAGERSAWSRLVNDAGIQMHRVPASFRGQLHRRNKRLPEGPLPGRRGQYRFRGRGPDQYNRGRFSKSPAISPPQIGMTRSRSAEPPAKQTTRKVVSKGCFAPPTIIRQR